MTQVAAHVPVLMAQVLEALAPLAGQHVVDGTFGAGGYSRAILAGGAQVVAFDRDPSARRFAEGLGDGFQLIDGRFSEMVEELGEASMDGVALDLGVSSMQLDEAERKRVEFQRNITKYVGAPLLGAVSCAAGAVMFAQIVQPGSLVGAPVSWLVGGNPFLGGVWLFANGVICFHEGYKFFMIALADQDEVNRVVREIKGLLPAAAT